MIADYQEKGFRKPNLVESYISLVEKQGLNPKIKFYVKKKGDIVCKNKETGQFISEESALEILASQD